jgi:hypothetical protein
VGLTRREALARAGAAVGLYGLVDALAQAPARGAAAATRPTEQHILEGVRVVRDNGAEVLVPPLHHEVLTTKVAAGDLRRAQRRLESALAELDRRYAPTPAGLGVTVAWGLPYFERRVERQWLRYRPRDLRARKPALLETERFPSDPRTTVLEENDAAILLRSDRLEHIRVAHEAIVDTGVFHVTSIRRGFAGGGFDGKQSLPKQMALAAGVPGADLIPDAAELFLGFTSTLRANLGPPRIANFETLGFVETPGGYFRGGTHMHLSHIDEDLESWYLSFSHEEQVESVFRPGLRLKPGTRTVAQGPADVSTLEQVLASHRRAGKIGHSGPIQLASRLQSDHVAEDGTVYRKGTAIPQRADFNTLDNPFAFSADGKVNNQPSAGVHFVVFNPSGDDFERNRLAMDGVLPGGTTLKVPPRNRAQGFNSVLTTTHRQNFLVPPRRHRSFPLAEL